MSLASAPQTAQDTATRPTAEPAGIRRRLASLLYESLLLLGVLGFTYILPLVGIGLAFGVTPPGAVLWLYLALVLGIYFIGLWRRNGQTLAMQTWEIKVVDALDGRIPSPRQCLLRYLLAWPSLCFFGAGLFWALFDRDRQFLHDRFAGTCVVFLRSRPATSVAGAAQR
ncbi:RDD family protein [Niveibacterium sp. SC-1]|uniref:RDD family protein n=1 Tax=Niveibacterium sp. SC-1 TaxID=3135646 RepID=UPI00311DA910